MSKHKQDKPVTILLVEDNATDVKIILRAFEKQKFSAQVENVTDGKEALQYLLHEGAYKDKEKCPDPDLILLDINMPRMDGHTFVKKLRSMDKVGEIPIIVFTTREGMKEAFKIEGVDDYVMKTIDGIDMVEKIREIMSFKQDFFND